jgi:hypothetical protein
MGVTDFECLIERNGQVLHGIELLEQPMTTEQELKNFCEDEWDGKISEDLLQDVMDSYEGAGARMGRLILIPRSLSLEEVTSIPLLELGKYPFRDEIYDWDEWDFPNFEGHSKFKMGEIPFPTSRECLWSNDDHWIISINPMVYDVYIRQLYPPELVPLAWYLIALDGTIPESYDKPHLYQLTMNKCSFGDNN